MKGVLICKICVLLATVAALGAVAQNQPVPAGYSTSLRGAAHDFDYLIGASTTPAVICAKA